MKTIVMTGGTSGLGEIAAQAIARAPDTHLIIGARRTGKLETIPLDLTRLASVRDFARAVIERLGDTEIDGLVLNAGTQFPTSDRRTEDGFETTFGVNVLAHYLLLRLLLPKLARYATVVITTSDTHDPERIPMGPREFDIEKLAHPPKHRKPTGFSAGFRAYAASKLGDLLIARGLAASNDAKTKNLNVVAYNPGLTIGTSLFRAWPLWAKIAMTAVGLVRPFARMNTVEISGRTLAELALARVTPPPGRIYASLNSRKLEWPDPSELAQRDEIVQRLWHESAPMVGLFGAGQAELDEESAPSAKGSHESDARVSGALIER
jgi:NAD(P)-dependent dehydrogenase (short-subunit alcohol dehydrogenase family)